MNQGVQMFVLVDIGCFYLVGSIKLFCFQWDELCRFRGMDRAEEKEIAVSFRL